MIGTARFSSMLMAARCTQLRGMGGVLAAGVASAVFLTGCAGGGGSDAAAASSSHAPSSSAAGTSAPDLASGLLPAAAFGPQANVVAVSLEQLQQGTGIAAAAGDLEVTPESCADAVKGTQPKLDEFDDVVGQSATIGSSVTAEVLVRGGPTKGAVGQLADAVGKCPQAQITSPSFGKATIAFQALPVSDLGDAAAALQYTTTVTKPDGTTMAIPALIGAVEDGDRLVMLVNFSTGGTPDAAAFATLLRQAYDAQAKAFD
jgi:hypothetical protein